MREWFTHLLYKAPYLKEVVEPAKADDTSRAGPHDTSLPPTEVEALHHPCDEQRATNSGTHTVTQETHSHTGDTRARTPPRSTALHTALGGSAHDKPLLDDADTTDDAAGEASPTRHNARAESITRHKLDDTSACLRVRRRHLHSSTRTNVQVEARGRDTRAGGGGCGGDGHGAMAATETTLTETEPQRERGRHAGVRDPRRHARSRRLANDCSLVLDSLSTADACRRRRRRRLLGSIAFHFRLTDDWRPWARRCAASCTRPAGTWCRGPCSAASPAAA